MSGFRDRLFAEPIPSLDLNRKDDEEARSKQPEPDSQHPLLKLQKTIGNQAVLRKLRATASANDTGNLVQRDTSTVSDGVTYETKSFGVGRERPTEVSGPVKNLKVGARGRTPRSMSLLHNPASPNGTADEMLGFDGGHVMGLSLGGDNLSYNVVPMYPGFNRGTWKNVESQLQNAATFPYSGMNFSAKIQLGYATSTSKIPNTVTAKGYYDKKGSNGKSTRTEVDYGTHTQPDDIATTPAATKAVGKLFNGDAPKKTLKGVMSNAVTEYKKVDEKGGEYLEENEHLPTSKRAEYPDSADNRPYEYLDILTFSGNLLPGTTLSPGRGFSQTQRTLILQANMARNGGVLKSDDPDDPIHKPPHSKPALSEQGASNFPEIDHIIPKSLGGSNMFSNARVVSWLLNNKEDRVKNIGGLVDMDRLAPISLPSSGTIKDKVAILIPYMIGRYAPITQAGIQLKLFQQYTLNVTEKWKEEIANKLKDMYDNDEVNLNAGEYSLK